MFSLILKRVPAPRFGGARGPRFLLRQSSAGATWPGAVKSERDRNNADSPRSFSGARRDFFPTRRDCLKLAAAVVGVAGRSPAGTGPSLKAGFEANPARGFPPKARPLVATPPPTPVPDTPKIGRAGLQPLVGDKPRRIRPRNAV
jgi:hypothetical protein